MSSIYYYEPHFSFSDFDRLISRAFGQESSATAHHTQNGNENGRQLIRGGFQPK